MARKRYRYRSAVTGRFISEAEYRRLPRSQTIREAAP